MKNLDNQIEQITGKGSRAERQRQEILDQRKALKEAERTERSFAYDLLMEFKALNKRLFIIIVVILALWFATIGGFVWYLNQYDYTSYEYQQDGEGYNNINHDIKGSVNNYNGTESQNQGTDKEK